MAKTTRGRVVYNRKPHLFTYADVLRIVRKVEGSRSKKIADIALIFSTVLAAWSDFFSLLSELSAEHKLLWIQRATFELLARLADLESLLVVKPSQAVDVLREFFEDLFRRQP